MKKIILYASALLFFASCQKEMATNQDPQTVSNASVADRNARKANTELQTYIQAWMRWILARPAAVAPFTDPDGSLQSLDQPYSSGVFMLAGGSGPDPVNRTVTISLSQYQTLFVPLVNIFAFSDVCDPSFAPKGGQNPEAFFKSLLTEAFNGPKELTLLWDNTSILSTKQKDLRANSGVFSFTVDPSWNNGCIAPTSTHYTDGYWALIPLTLGEHQLVIGGNFNLRRMKWEFSNLVYYTINVIP
jgi:hypothetical protein